MDLNIYLFFIIILMKVKEEPLFEGESEKELKRIQHWISKISILEFSKYIEELNTSIYDVNAALK